MIVTILGIPFNAQQKIQNIKELRIATTSRSDAHGIGLKSAKSAIDEFLDVGCSRVDIPALQGEEKEIFSELIRRGFILKEQGPDPLSERDAGNLVAVRMMMSEALEEDDVDIIEGLLPAYRVLLGRNKSYGGHMMKKQGSSSHQTPSLPTNTINAFGRGMNIPELAKKTEQEERAIIAADQKALSDQKEVMALADKMESTGITLKAKPYNYEYDDSDGVPF